MNVTFWEIAQAVGALNDWKSWPDFNIIGVEFDSRKIETNHLFVPLKGTNDGHEFITKAIDNGAKASFWSWSMEEVPSGFPVLQVEDTLVAMQKLAVYYLEKQHPSVIAITGSNGKTTTKDMTEAVLAQKFKTYKTQGNYNNDIGVPYTILHMPEETEKLVLEMGMDHAKELSFLSKMATPDVAAITMIGEAHIENLGSRENIAAAKMEITDGLKEQGLLVIPQAEPLLLKLIKPLEQQVQTVALGEEADYTAHKIKSEKEQTLFSVNDSEETYCIPVPGKYNVSNALIAIAIGHWFNMENAAIQEGLKNFQLTKNRTEWLKAANGAEILSDVYNANPTAMGLVLDEFSEMNTQGKRIAVLGDMLELGPDSEEMHCSMAEHLDSEKVQEVFLYGTEMKALFEKLQANYSLAHLHFYEKAQKENLIEKVKTLLEPEDMILLKGSNGMGLSEVIQSLV